MRQVELPYAKSLANRAMVLRALHGAPLPSPDPLWSDDMHAMRRVLEAKPDASGIRRADAGPAGTAYRFGMAYWAAQPNGDVLLVASPRLRERPIQPLVDALRQLGAVLEPHPEGWRVQGRRLTGGSIAVDGRQSSQFASALELIATACEQPIALDLEAGLVSAPYLAMTQAMARQHPVPWPPERDWSAAAVFLAGVGLSGRALRLPGLGLQSLQGDAAVAQWGAELGFMLTENSGSEGAELWAEPVPARSGPWNVDFSNTPDLAMPLIVAAALHGRSGAAQGLATLNANESPRLDATAELLRTLGCTVTAGPDALQWTASPTLPEGPLVLDSLDDHRMAFCAALIGLRLPVDLRGAEAVSKSFPDFWAQFRALQD
ncbi:MAG: 3-phosphoshikimate 1-carboxyvinyltransferase [Schleiferiaceae bacterium]